MRIKSPSNTNRSLIKNKSFENNNFSKNKKTIYKLHDRLFNYKILSILSKKKSPNSLKNSYITPNNENIEKIKSFRIKSFDNQSYLNFSQYKRKKTSKKRLHSSIEINKNDEIDKPRVSFIIHRDSKISERDSMILLPETPVLQLRKGPKNEENYMLINQIIKFNKNKKEKEQILLSPMKLGKDYTDFIERKNKLRFNLNFNSPYIHKMSAKCLIESNYLNLPDIKDIKIQLKLQKRKQKEDEEELKIIEIEKNDKIEEMEVDLQNYKRAIKVFLTDETKLNHISFHEEFFDYFPNKVNFLFDGRRFPTIKNNLNKIVIEFGNLAAYEWNRLNMIEVSSLLYLHKLKAKIQRELDEIQEDNKEKQFKINQQIGKYNINYKKRKKIKNLKNSINNNLSENDERNDENKNENNNNINQENCEEEEEEEEKEEIITDKENLYELEEFFVHKGQDNKRIIIANNKIANVVYHNPDFYKSIYTRNKIIKKGKNKKKNKDIDLYL